MSASDVLKMIKDKEAEFVDLDLQTQEENFNT